MNAITPNLDLDASIEMSAPGRHSVELLYTPAESIFAAAAPDMVRNGWSVFPQEIDRRPSKVYGATIRWSEEHDLKNTLPTAATMELWRNHCATANVACVFGPASGNTFAIDIDVLDERVSFEIAALADEMLGYSPLRREGRFPKIALIYRHEPGEGNRVPSLSRGIVLPLPAEGEDPDGSRLAEIQALAAAGQGMQIEIQGEGKLLTFHGRHHKTGTYFKWLDGSPQVVGPEAAPLVTKEQVEAFLAAVVAIYGSPTSKGNVHRPLRMTAIGNADLGDLVTPNVGSMDGKKFKDGRETLLYDMCFNVVRCNPRRIFAARDSGADDLSAL